jgi:hypothetical protein
VQNQVGIRELGELGIRESPAKRLSLYNSLTVALKAAFLAGVQRKSIEIRELIKDY